MGASTLRRCKKGNEDLEGKEGKDGDTDDEGLTAVDRLFSPIVR